MTSLESLREIRAMQYVLGNWDHRQTSCDTYSTVGLGESPMHARSKKTTSRLEEPRYRLKYNLATRELTTIPI